jgi:Secretion system C-terminal sorting domain
MLLTQWLPAQCILPLSESNVSNHEVAGTYTGQSFTSDCIATIEQITVTSGAAANIPNVTLRVWEERVTGTTITFIQNNITINGLNVPTSINLTTLVTPKPVIVPPGIQNVIKYYFTLESNSGSDLKLKAFDGAVNFQLALGTAITTSALTTYSTTVDLVFNIVTSSAVLPIQYMSLTGVKTDNKVLVKWETETSSKYFEVERRAKDKDFTTIGIVQSPKEAKKTFTHSYQFEDETPLDGANYYRIKQVGLDGSVSYSKTVTVLNFDKSGLGVFPNPVSDKLRIQAEEGSLTNLKVYHINGQLLYNQTVAAQNVDLDVSNFAKGVYVVAAHLNNETHLTKFVKN